MRKEIIWLYVKLRLSYQLPKSLISKVHAEADASVYVTGLVLSILPVMKAF